MAALAANPLRIHFAATLAAAPILQLHHVPCTRPNSHDREILIVKTSYEPLISRRAWKFRM